MYILNPWLTAQTGKWPELRPIAVTSSETGKTRIILYRNFASAMDQDSTLVPWPGTSTGSCQEEQVYTAWKTVGGKPWQYEVTWEDGDHIFESRYRLEGETPVLIETRGRDIRIAFEGIVLGILTLIVWKSFAWSQRRMKLSETPRA